MFSYSLYRKMTIQSQNNIIIMNEKKKILKLS